MNESKYFADGHFLDSEAHTLPPPSQSLKNTKEWLAKADKERKKREKEIRLQQQIEEKKRRKAAKEGRKLGLRKMMTDKPLREGPVRGDDLTPKESRAAKRKGKGMMSWFGFGGKRRTKKRRKKRRTKSRRKTKRRRKSRRRTKRRRRKR